MKNSKGNNIEENQSPIDFKILDDLRNIGKKRGTNLLEKIFSIFLEHSPLLLKNFHHAVEENDVNSMKEIAHSLKSSSSNIGAAKLAQLCKDSETIFCSGNNEKARDILAQVEREYDLVKQTMLSELEKMEPNKS